MSTCLRRSASARAEFCGVLFSALLLGAQPCINVTRADFLYGVDWTGEDAAIFTLDTVTGELTKYFGHPANDICALDFDSNGSVYLLQTSAL